MNEIQLHVIRENASTITLGWDPVPGAVGYEFFADDRKSSTTDPTRTRVVFGKQYSKFRVVALGALAEGDWPSIPTPPPPPPSGFGKLGVEIGAGDNVALAKTLKKVAVIREDSITQAKVDFAKTSGALFIGLATGMDTAETLSLVRDWPTIHVWELDNEPYYAGVKMAEWAPMMLATATAIKALDPTYRTILPLLVQSDGGDYPDANGTWNPDPVKRAWVWQAFNYAPGLKGSVIDGYSMHPYSDPRDGPPDFSVIEKVVGQLKAANAVKPLSFTEWGWSVGTGQDQVTEQEQAAFFETFVGMARARGDVESIVAYCLQSWGTGFEPGFGIFDPNGSPRLVKATFDRLA